MKKRSSAAASLGLALLGALAAASYGSLRARPAAAQVSAAPSASAAAAAPSVAAAPEEKKALTVETYDWPTQPSPEPKEEEWAGAVDLGTVKAETSWIFGGVTCAQRAVREWVRVTCQPNSESHLVGAVWGMAGDVSTVKGKFVLTSTLPQFKGPPQNFVEELDRGMGVSATVTFQAKPGSALVLGIDQIAWEESYDDRSVGAHRGMLVDVSWALGEKGPSLFYR